MVFLFSIFQQIVPQEVKREKNTEHIHTHQQEMHRTKNTI